MKLPELIQAVQEKTLDKYALENYRDELSNLYALMNIELADILKEKALFIDSCEEKTDIAKKRRWQVTAKGLREIELKSYCVATKEMLNSLRNRLYNFY